MMKKIMILLFLIFINLRLIAQEKAVIDTGMLGEWPSLMTGEGGIAMNKNGRYVAYGIYNQPIGKYSLVIQDMSGTWKKSIICKRPQILFFTDDNRQLCWQDGESIWLQRVSSNLPERLVSVSSEISYPKDNKGTWLAIKEVKDLGKLRLTNLVDGSEQIFNSIKSHHWLKGGKKLLLITSNGDLKLYDLITRKELSFPEVKNYVLSPDEKSMVFMRENGETNILQWYGLSEGVLLTIWTGASDEQTGGYIYDKSGYQLAFNVQSSDKNVTLWHYKKGESRAGLEVENNMIDLRGLKVSGVRNISDNGRWLFFNMRKELPVLAVEQVAAQVDIWSYRDEVLNPIQPLKAINFKDYIAVVELGRKKVQLLEQKDGEKIAWRSIGDHVFLETGFNEAGSWWPHSGVKSSYLVSLEDGRRNLMPPSKSGIAFSVSSSPGGRWIYYWNPEQGHYYSLNPATGKTINLTERLPVTLVEDVNQGINSIPVGLIGWYVEDSAVLIYDNFDMWKVDPNGKKVPVNITGGYGKQHGIKLRIVYGKDIYSGDEELLLLGYDVWSKYNGFFKCRLDKPGQPEMLSMGPYTYYQPLITSQNFSNPMLPLNAGEGVNKRWVVMRQSAIEYPNLYVSKDLKDFKALTHLQPQNECNWLTAEPVNWRMYNGQMNTGVLYKPENFDPKKRYPIIFNYYEKFAHRCYQFPLPELTSHNINIPWFVSREYLVFTPDIQYTVASKPGGMTISEAANNAVSSAAEYLSQRPYIDKSKMAIQGHSFGGHETNAIISQTDLFAAASEVAGYSDHLSAYLTLVTGDENSSIEKYHKIDHFNQRMGATPWERPDLFRRNSPVQNADKVTTPLLITHNKKDASVNFRQGLEMYMALRRLGKPCWLLQYDNSGHVLEDKDALDYTIRLTQYFDHYLKGAPAPQWMTKNNLAQYKNKNNLYELVPKGNCGKDCKVCKEWNEKSSHESQVGSRE
jgi:hypothetical protein